MKTLEHYFLSLHLITVIHIAVLLKHIELTCFVFGGGGEYFFQRAH